MVETSLLPRRVRLGLLALQYSTCREAMRVRERDVEVERGREGWREEGLDGERERERERE